MAEYLVIKREKCDVSEFHFDNCNCGGTGYIETQVPLLDVLKEIYVMGEPLAGLPTKIQVLPDDAWIGDDEPSVAVQMAQV